MNHLFDQQAGWLCILIMAAVTVSVRALPFWVQLPLSFKNVLSRGQNIFPSLFLTVLVVYCLAEPLNIVAYGVQWREHGFLILASGYVFLSHLWCEKIWVSLGGGVLLYLALVN